MALDKTNTNQLYASNVELSGNFKIIVQEDNFYLDTFSNIGEFQDIRFNRFQPYLKTYYASDISRLLKQKPLQTKSIYENSESNLFKAGPRLNTNILYQEEFSYFAPLWYVKNDIPEYFIVFQTEQLFHDQNISDFNTFLSQQLLKADIVYSYKIKDSNLETYIKNSYDKLNSKTYDFLNEDRPNHLTLYGIDIDTGLYTSKFIVSEYTKSTITDDYIIEQFRANRLLSSNILNLEFLFDSDQEFFQDYYYHYHENEYHHAKQYDYFYGVYCNLNNFDTFLLDIHEHNKTLSTQIRKTYQQLDQLNFQIEDEENAPIYVSKFNYNSNFTKESETLYLIQDKYDQLYNIYDYENYKFLLTNKTFNLESITGIKLNTFKEIPATLLNSLQYQNIKLTINKDSVYSFQNGDYISIRPGGVNREWRIIASDENCCGSSNTCYYDNPNIIFKSEEVEFLDFSNFDEYHAFDCYHYAEEYHDYHVDYTEDVVQLNITVDGIVDLIEGNDITLTWTECGTAKTTTLPLYDVYYDFDNSKTYFTLFDLLGYDFRYSFLIEEVTFSYNEPGYHYTYFRPDAPLEDVAKNICDALNLFENKMFNANCYQNNIIITSSIPGKAYDRFILKYNFSGNKGAINNLLINDQSLTGKVIRKVNDQLLYISYQNTAQFSEAKDQKFYNRFIVDKAYSSDIDGTEIISTKNYKLSKLQSFRIDDKDVYQSNYIDNISKLEDYNMYQVEDDDTVNINSSGNITAYTQFYPILNKLNLISMGSVSVTSIENSCVYDTYYEYEIINPLNLIISLDIHGASAERFNVYYQSGNVLTQLYEEIQYHIDYNLDQEIISIALLGAVSIDTGDKIIFCYDSIINNSFSCEFDTTFEFSSSQSDDFVRNVLDFDYPSFDFDVVGNAKDKEEISIYHLKNNVYIKLAYETNYNLTIHPVEKDGVLYNAVQRVLILQSYLRHNYRFDNNEQFIICYDKLF